MMVNEEFKASPVCGISCEITSREESSPDLHFSRFGVWSGKGIRIVTQRFPSASTDELNFSGDITGILK
jgi:hypothetical protein